MKPENNPIAAATVKVLEAPPEKRLHALIESPFTSEILERMPAQDAYLMVKEAFGSDSSILLSYTPTEKIISFIDLDCWEHDTLSSESLLRWFSELAEASEETLLRTMEALDPEVMILLFQPYLKVAITRPMDDNIPELVEAGYETLDNNYFFAFSEASEETATLKNILDMLFLHHQDMYHRIVEGVNWEHPSEMEESAYQQRAIRLMELGFPSPEEASAVYRHIAPERILKRGFRPEQMPRFGDREYYLPTVYRDEITTGALAHAIQTETSDEIRQRFSFELVYLINKLIMADYQPLNDIQALRAGASKALAFTALGLALARRAQGRSTQDVLENFNAQTLFSLAYNTVTALQQRLKNILTGVEAHMIPSVYRELSESLLQKHPTYAGQPFSSLEQLERIETMLGELETLRRIIRHVPWKGHALTDTNIGVEGLDLHNIILTALAVNIATSELMFRPLLPAELRALLERATIFEHAARRSKAGFLDDLCRLIEALDSEIPAELVRQAATGLIARWEDEIAGLTDLARIDPRYLTCLVVRLI